MSKDLKDTKNLLEIDYAEMERVAALTYVEERAKLSLESREERAIRKACDFGKNYGVHTHPPSLTFPKVPIDVGFSKTVKLVPGINFSTKEPLPLKKEGLPDIERGYYRIFEIVGDRVYFENGFKIFHWNSFYNTKEESPEKIFGMFRETLIHYFEEGKVFEGMTAFTPETPVYAVKAVDYVDNFIPQSIHSDLSAKRMYEFWAIQEQALNRMHRKKNGKHSDYFKELQREFERQMIFPEAYIDGSFKDEDIAATEVKHEVKYAVQPLKYEGIETRRLSHAKSNTEERSRDKLPENSGGTKKR